MFSLVQLSSVTQLCPTLQPHGLQHARPPCPSPTPRVHPNPCPSSRWCHPTISSSVVPFSSCPQSFPASESFPMSQLFASGGQSIGVSALTSVLPMNTQDWSPLGWTGMDFRMDSTTDFTVLHHLPEFTQTHVSDYCDLESIQINVTLFQQVSFFPGHNSQHLLSKWPIEPRAWR